MSNNKNIKIFITIVAVVLLLPIVIIPLATVIVYESVFSSRYETSPGLAYSVDEFEGLNMERSDFSSTDGVTLAGYKYSKEWDKKGVVVLSHGLGGGGHNMYMPFIDVFTSNGYAVFAYDAHGNDNSGGSSAEGLPQGVIDLDCAINHVLTLEEYEGLPIVLFGHSWGGYSCGNVLNFHPEIKAAVIIAGCNESEELLYYQGKQVMGSLAELMIPSVYLYEEIKFGSKFTDITAVEGMKNSKAGVLIVHSENDSTVPPEYGYYTFYKEFGDSERFEFVLYEDKGHDYLFYSEAAWDYREQLNRDYIIYVEEHGGEYNESIKAEFMETYLDKSKCFEPDPELMEKVLNMYDKYCISEN